MIFPFSLGSELYLTFWSIGSSQNSCDLVARYSELENKHIQLELDLKLAQENLTKAKEETKGMFGETLTTTFPFVCFKI